VLVLLNGKRLNSAQGGGFDLSRIDPETVERIEVLRGGSSARYGENALGGVVNIVTKEAAKPQNGGSAFLHYGSWNTVKGGLSLEGASVDGLADGYLSVSGLYSEGAYGYETSDGEEEIRTNADVRQGDLYGTLSLYPGDYLQLKGSLTAHADEKGVPGTPNFPTETARMSDIQCIAAFGAHWERGSFNLDSSLSADAHQRHYEDPDYALGAQDDTHQNLAIQSNTTGEFKFHLPWSRAEAALTPLLSYRFDALRSTAVIRSAGLEEGEGDILRHEAAAGISGTLPLPELRGMGLQPILYPALRVDGYYLFDEADDDELYSYAPTWQLGLTFPWKKLILKGSIGTSFRSPSFDDLFWPSTAFAAGNRDLKPEQAFAWDAGMELKPWTWLSVEASYFDRYVKDLIVWTPGAGGVWRPSNVDNARIRGVELAGHADIPLSTLPWTLGIDGSTTWMDPRNTTEGSVNEGKMLPGKSPFSASAAMELQGEEGVWKGAYIRTELVYTGPRYITAANTKALDDALVFNAGLGMPLGTHWKFLARLDNLFDVVYVDLRNYPVPGREFSVRVNYDF